MKTYIIFALAIFLSSTALGDEFLPPNIGKFNSCEFGSKCTDSVGSCRSQVPQCLAEMQEASTTECNTVWSTRSIGLGIKTKIPEFRCKNVANVRRFECLKERELQISKCNERNLLNKQSCLLSAEREENRCEQIKSSEIAAAEALQLEMESALKKLEEQPYILLSSRQKDILSDQFAEEQLESLKIVRTNRSSISIFISKFWVSAQFDWQSVPSSSYGASDEMKALGDYLVLSPNYLKDPTLEMLIYGLLQSQITDSVGIDGLAQIQTHSAGTIDEFIIEKLNDICERVSCSTNQVLAQ